MSTQFQRVKATQDEDGHWYVIPELLYKLFRADLENEEIVESGGFDNKYGKYRTGGDLNLVQLYAEV